MSTTDPITDVGLVQPPAAGRRFWQPRPDRPGGPPGADLAAVRRGVGREPGVVPSMWPYYTTLRADGTVGIRLRAEHLALTLYAVHQQSQPTSMHSPGVGVGAAALRLRSSGKFSPEAVDRRFHAIATATTLAEVGMHLRGLVTQLRGIGQPLDYDWLDRDLRDWQDPARQSAVRRRWGGQYYAEKPGPKKTTVPVEITEPTPKSDRSPS
jgi:CRISPR system Cascade subunit CasB